MQINEQLLAALQQQVRLDRTRLEMNMLGNVAETISEETGTVHRILFIGGRIGGFLVPLKKQT